MNVQNDISQELRLLSALVATISRQTPYRVADDYFDNFPGQVMLRIGTKDEPMGFNALPLSDTKPAYHVPAGYFEGFAEGVLARIKAGGGKDAAAPISLGEPESAAVELAGLSPVLAKLRHLATYRMPEGYFEELSPILTLAHNINPYTVPEEYFYQLPTEIEEKLLKPQEAKKPAKVVAFGSRRTNWLKYSAAAAVAGLILTFGWMRFGGSGGDVKPAGPDNVTVAKVSDQDLQNFMSLHESQDQDQSSSDLATNQEFSDSDFKSLLGEVPDGALKEYMDEHGGADGMATN
jgi:hypothetical protein